MSSCAWASPWSLGTSQGAISDTSWEWLTDAVNTKSPWWWSMDHMLPHSQHSFLQPAWVAIINTQSWGAHVDAIGQQKQQTPETLFPGWSRRTTSFPFLSDWGGGGGYRDLSRALQHVWLNGIESTEKEESRKLASHYLFPRDWILNIFLSCETQTLQYLSFLSWNIL